MLCASVGIVVYELHGLALCTFIACGARCSGNLLMSMLGGTGRSSHSEQQEEVVSENDKIPGAIQR